MKIVVNVRCQTIFFLLQICKINEFFKTADLVILVKRLFPLIYDIQTPFRRQFIHFPTFFRSTVYNLFKVQINETITRTEQSARAGRTRRCAKDDIIIYKYVVLYCLSSLVALSQEILREREVYC